MGGATVNHKKLFDMLRKLRLKMKRNALFIKGGSGIGKSEAVEDEAIDYSKTINREFIRWNEMSTEQRETLLAPDSNLDKVHVWVDMRMADKQATDLLGMPDFTKGRFVEWKPRLLFAVLSDPRCSATLFFDEFNLSQKTVQSASYQTILDRCVGDVTLSKDVFIVAAGNRIEDNKTVIESAPPLNNRFYHVTLMVPTADEWIDYNMSSDFPEPRLWGFLKAKEEYIHNYKANQKEEAFSTPRRLQFLAEDLKGVTDDDKATIELYSVSGCGPNFGELFLTYLDMAKKVDVDAILEKPETVVPYLKEPDLRYSILTTISYKCKRDNEKTPKALVVAEFLSDEDAVFLVRLLGESVGKKAILRAIRSGTSWEKIGPKVEPIMSTWERA